jgi:hypothetical protein
MVILSMLRKIGGDAPEMTPSTPKENVDPVGHQMGKPSSFCISIIVFAFQFKLLFTWLNDTL